LGKSTPNRRNLNNDSVVYSGHSKVSRSKVAVVLQIEGSAIKSLWNLLFIHLHAVGNHSASFTLGANLLVTLPAGILTGFKELTVALDHSLYITRRIPRNTLAGEHVDF